MTDISEVAPHLYVASRFYALENLPRHSVVIDCSASLTDDDKPQNEAIELLARTALTVSRFKGGNAVLLCDAGRNRSAVVAAKALMLDGYPSEEAIKVVRAAREGALGRSGGALTNASFVEYLISP